MRSLAALLCTVAFPVTAGICLTGREHGTATERADIDGARSIAGYSAGT